MLRIRVYLLTNYIVNYKFIIYVLAWFLYVFPILNYNKPSGWITINKC